MGQWVGRAQRQYSREQERVQDELAVRYRANEHAAVPQMLGHILQHHARF